MAYAQFNISGIQQNIPYVDIDSNLTDKQFSDKYLSKKLSNKEKEAFYDSVMKNDLELFKSYIFGTPSRAPYNIFEEVSKPGYGWTTFHYAMHYGKLDIIKFIIGYLYSQNIINIAFRLKSNDGRCPLLCLLKSKNLTPEVKLDVFNKITSTFSIPISDAVKERLEFVKSNIGKNLPKKNNPNPYPDHPLITDILTTDEKMEFYNAAVKGNLELFKSLLFGSPTKKPYNIFEEVSAPKFYWTVFHYAMHYGKWDIIFYIIDYLYHYNLLQAGLNLITKDNRCPLLCLLKSNQLTKETKKEIFDRIITTFPNIPLSDNVIKELELRNLTDLIKKIRPSY